VRVTAPAKINLTLRVRDRRADGYHDLRTIFQAVALHDTLRFEHRPGPFTLDCDDPACPGDRTNLVWQAAQALWKASGRRGAVRDVHVRIVKRIPAQAGLGGGSSDAAATLRALALLWRRALPPERLRALAGTLGADVPFFLAGGTALGVERGDILFSLPDLPSLWVALALPAFGVSTRDAYRWLDEDRAAHEGRRPPRPRSPRRQPHPAFAFLLPFDERGNDLERPVRARHPAIGRLVGAMDRRGAVSAAMSGSGSAVYGLFTTERDARAAADALRGPSCRTLVTRTLSRRRFERLSAASLDLPASRSIV
jgi:4-diphosphocytidyl-2-C-methyl-D-erythritol kinase